MLHLMELRNILNIAYLFSADGAFDTVYDIS